MSLSENEYRVLNVLLKNPSLSYTEIAQILNLSVTSIRNLLFSLMDYSENATIDDEQVIPVKSENSLNNQDMKKTSKLNFFAKFNYYLLDLKRIDFFIACSTVKQLQNVKLFCEAHPYTAFRGRIFGGTNGVYVLLFMPEESINMLLIILEALKREHLIDDFTRLINESSFSLYSLLKIDLFDVSQNRWNFNFDEFEDSFKQVKSSSETVDFFKKVNHKNIVSKLDKIDALILMEWGYGAGPRKTKTELLYNITNFEMYRNYIKDLKLNRYIISDHVDALLKENIINNVGIGFDRRKIQILTTLFYVGEARKEFLNAFGNFIQSNDFPFESTLSVGNLDPVSQTAKFTWRVNFTADLVSEFTEFLFENSISLKTFIASSDTSDNESYPLYHENFLQEANNTGHWNISEENCLFNPLKTFFDSSKAQTLVDDIQKNIKK